MFKKPITELTKADIERVCADRVPEGDLVEFKRDLATKKAEGRQADRISDKARDKILAEVVAFANTHGGTLILGIEESGAAPHFAEHIRPLPDCAHLGERFRQMAQTAIDPPIPGLQIAAVRTEPDDAGVLVFQVPASLTAPHRLGTDLRACVRRADRTESMTMREIQDLTIAMYERQYRLDQRFAEMAAALGTQGIYLVALPLRPVPLPDLQIRNPLQQIEVKTQLVSSDHTENSEALGWGFGPVQWRPTIRGMIGYFSAGDHWQGEVQVDEQGGIRIYFRPRNTRAKAMLSERDYLVLIAYKLNAISALVAGLGLSTHQYGLEIGLRFDEPPSLKPLHWYNSKPIPNLRRRETIFPRYPCTGGEGNQAVLSLACRDLWNSMELPPPDYQLSLRSWES